MGKQHGGTVRAAEAPGGERNSAGGDIEPRPGREQLELARGVGKARWRSEAAGGFLQRAAGRNRTWVTAQEASLRTFVLFLAAARDMGNLGNG